MTSITKDLFDKFLVDNDIKDEFYEYAGGENNISLLPLEKYITAPFKWKSTPQGFSFWSAVNDSWKQTLKEYSFADKYTIIHEKKLVAVYPAKVLDKNIECPENGSIELFNNFKFIYEHIYKPIKINL